MVSRDDCPEQKKQCGQAQRRGEPCTRLPGGVCLAYSCLAHASGQDSPFRYHRPGRKTSAAQEDEVTVSLRQVLVAHSQPGGDQPSGWVGAMMTHAGMESSTNVCLQAI